MAEIIVHRPDVEAQPTAAVKYAKRGVVPDGAVLTIIENGKPQARDLMQIVAGELQQRFPIARVDVFSKPSAGKPIDPDEAKVIAARSYMVITGLGD
jgi:hypothetical protein